MVVPVAHNLQGRDRIAGIKLNGAMEEIFPRLSFEILALQSLTRKIDEVFGDD